MPSREKIIAGVALLLSFAAGLSIGGRPSARLTGLILLAGLGVAAIIVVRSRRRSVRALADLADALGREKVLSDLGAALLAASDPARTHRAVADAAGDLVRDCPGGWASVLPTGPDDDTAAKEPALLLPLVRGGRSFGVLAAGADQTLPSGVVAALEAVRTQACLALEGEALGAEMAHRATRDPLTGLGNRSLVRDRLTAALARARRSGRPVGVLLLNLQGFRQVNEVHGHDAGDELLRVVADRLRAGVRTEDTIGRLGGDRFAVIAEDLRTAQDIVIIAERMVVELGRSVPVAGRVVRAPASVGIALSHPDTESPDQLLREAEAAMSAAQSRGGGRYQLHGATPAA